ncbi:MAG: relaxase/mobilization nuclease domain-containing protein [Burkholderiales bacterium]
MRKAKRGTGFRGVLDYSIGKHGARIIAGNMTGQTPRELAAEFAQARQLRQDIKKPTWHQALSLPPGEKISDERWAAIAVEYMQEMGFSDRNQWLAVLHTDRDHQHIHLIASRIGLDRKIWYGQNENLLSSRITQRLEKDYGLTRTRGPDEPSLQKACVDAPEKEMWSRKGQQPPKESISDAIEQALTKARTLEAFMAVMEARGIQVKVNQSSTTGKISGLSFELDGHAYKASQIHRKYRWANLQKQFDERSTNATQPHPASPRRIPPACRRDRLHYLPELDVVLNTRSSEMLLQANVSDCLGYGRTQHEHDPALRWGNGVAPIDNQKQAYKARLLENYYQAKVRDALRMSLNSIRFPSSAGEPLSIRLLGGGEVTDHGDRLTCKSGEAAEIQALVELARVKGWDRVLLTGRPDFQRRATEAYAQAGIQVVSPVGTEQQIHDAFARLAETKAQERKAQERIEQQQQSQSMKGVLNATADLNTKCSQTSPG